MPEEYGSQYDEDLENEGYVVCEEAITFDSAEETPEADDPEEDDALLTVAVSKNLQCRKCQLEFPSRTKLFKHVYTNDCSTQQVSPVKKAERLADDPTLLTSSKSFGVSSPIVHAKPKPIGEGLNDFVGYSYISMNARFSPGGPESTICADSGCSRPLVDCK